MKLFQGGLIVRGEVRRGGGRFGDADGVKCSQLLDISRGL